MEPSWRSGYSRYKGFFLNIYQLYKKRQDVRMFTELILTLVTSGVFLVFALKPTIITILDLVKEIKAKEETVAQMDTKIQNLKKAQGVISQEQTRINILKSAIPDGPDPVTFSRQMEGVAGTNGTGILGVSLSDMTIVGEPTAKTKNKDSFPAGAIPLTFSVGFSGSFESLLNLISNAESTRRPMKIDSLIITRPKSKDVDTGILGLAITGRVPYFLKSSQ